jgi:hypothetical protein
VPFARDVVGFLDAGMWAHRSAALVLLACLGGCSWPDFRFDFDAGPPQCPLCQTEGQVAFDLTCGPADITRISLSGPCATSDAGAPTAWEAYGREIVSVLGTSPGNCHIELIFATGFTYSGDVTFTMMSSESPVLAGCSPCPPSITATPGFFAVDNPPTTCFPVHSAVHVTAP